MTITVAGHTIKLKKATKPVAAVAKNAAAAKIVQTLVWLGKSAATRADNFDALRRYVSGKAKTALSSSMADLPKWMQDIVRALLSGGNAPQHA